ncbi:hypothetical protein EB796_005689 [Bugula neritina]|uniref:Uncharacterized protein n=1 Tax=Bugula neritina TaxID=10212 RepID=A0A7J7KCU1_BUGNE|nr:hypothetical protein EB796_005689 [Bugula neritina]
MQSLLKHLYFEIYLTNYIKKFIILLYVTINILQDNIITTDEATTLHRKYNCSQYASVELKIKEETSP